MLKDVLESVKENLNTQETRQTLDECIVSPLFNFLWEKYSRQYTIVRNAFFFIAVLLVAQIVISVIMYKRLTVMSSRHA